MRRTATHRLTAPLAAAVVTMLLLAGCGDDDPEATPSPTGDSTPSGASSPADPTPTEPTEPTAEPASGPTLTMPNSTVHAPEGWTKASIPVETQVGADSPDFSGAVTLGEIDAFGKVRTADELGQVRLDSNVYQRPPKLLPTEEVDGVDMYHVAGRVNEHQWIEEYGAIVDDQYVTLTFDFLAIVPEKERAEVIDAVVSSFSWR